MKLSNNQTYNARLTRRGLQARRAVKIWLFYWEKLQSVHIIIHSNGCISTKHFYHSTATKINSKNYTVYSVTEQIETITQQMQFNAFTTKVWQINVNIVLQITLSDLPQPEHSVFQVQA